MRGRRWSALLAALVAVGIVGGPRLAGAFGPSSAVSPPAPDRVSGLRIYYRSPVLVRAGERVQMPVGVLCATARGRACRASVTLAYRVGRGAWGRTIVDAVPSLAFDLTRPAGRAAGSSTNGSVSFSFQAHGPEGRTTTLPDPTGSLAFYVAARLPVVRAPLVPFGQTRTGRTVLFLPWGTGPGKAGLEPGHESATLGPSSFDVDASGRIYLADPLQGRVALFSNGRLVRAIRTPIGARALIAAGPDGASYVLDRSGRSVTIRGLEASGAVDAPKTVGQGIPGGVRLAGGRLAVDVMPLDAWVALDGRLRPMLEPTAGRLLSSDEQLLSTATERSVRLGYVRGGTLLRPVEIKIPARLGDLALAEPDSHGGYWIVVRVWRERPAADQYEVLHVSDTRVLSSFAVASSGFADTPPMSRFRLGPDGALYQLTTSPDGLRVVRFDLGEES